MGKLFFTLACGDYDRTKPLITGRVKPEGIDLNYIALEPEELFWRMIKHSEFDAAEFSLGAYIILCGKKDERFLALPIFPSRSFRHSAVFINRKAHIVKAEDLRGKRIGVADYTMTATVWIRAFLEHDYGVAPRDIKWFTGGQDKPGRKQRIDVELPSDVHIEDIGERTLNEMLDKGEIDALIGARAPQCYYYEPSNVERLWPNYAETELDYYKRTGIFPIMHTIVIRRDLLERNPWVALSLYKAFCEAKDLCQKELYTLSTLKCMLPWSVAQYEMVLEQMGSDFWPYGLEANRNTLETFVQYCQEQGFIKERMDIGSIFTSSTQDLYTI